MFNVWSFERKKTLNDNIEKMKNSYVHNEAMRKKKQEQLVLNYKKRVDNFVMQMAEHPIVTRDTAPETFKIRDEEPSKFVGPPAFSFKNSFKNEKERIKENMEKNKELYSDYAPLKCEYRTREIEKEIQPDMHFTSTGVERIASKLERMINNSVELTGLKHQKFPDSYLFEISKSPVATKRFIAKNLLPELHYKTHFKATTSLYLSLPDSLLDQYEKELQRQKVLYEKEKKEASFMAAQKEDGTPKASGGAAVKFRTDDTAVNDSRNESKNNTQPNLRRKISGDDIDKKLMGPDAGKKQHTEGLDPREVSKTVLVKCNIIREKKENVPVLRKGEGHVMSMSDKSLRQIYEDVYHKTIDFAGK